MHGETVKNIKELRPAMHETTSVTKLSWFIMRETVIYCDNGKKYINKACRRHAVLTGSWSGPMLQLQHKDLNLRKGDTI
jgi:hypothetical protein